MLGGQAGREDGSVRGEGGHACRGEPGAGPLLQVTRELAVQPVGVELAAGPGEGGKAFGGNAAAAFVNDDRAADRAVRIAIVTGGAAKAAERAGGGFVRDGVFE